MQIQQTERVFRYSGGLVLPDPDPSLGIEAVRQVYASSYPEIITAAVSGPELVDGKHVYTFKTAVGTKSSCEDVSVMRAPYWREPPGGGV